MRHMQDVREACYSYTVFLGFWNRAVAADFEVHGDVHFRVGDPAKVLPPVGRCHMSFLRDMSLEARMLERYLLGLGKVIGLLSRTDILCF